MQSRIQEIKQSYSETKRKGDQLAPVMYFVIRPLSFYITPFFLRCGFTANGVTYTGMAMGIIAVILAAAGGIWLPGAGIFGFLYLLLDYVDGNVARVRGTTSHFGKFIDGLSASLFYPLFVLGLGLGIILNPQSDTGVSDNWIFLLTGMTVYLLAIDPIFLLRYVSAVNHIKQESSASTIVSIDINTETTGWRTLPRKFDSLYYQAWFFLWFVFCLLKQPLILLYILASGALVATSLNCAKHIIKAHRTLRVHRQP